MPTRSALVHFGESVAISGATAIVGAYGDDDNGDFSGSAYLFDAAFAPGTCPPDFDGDGNVGILDLLALLANWGACPPPVHERLSYLQTHDLHVG